MSIKLSILIPFSTNHIPHLDSLMTTLKPQLVDEVEVITDGSMEYNIGVKRQKMLELAKGDYIVFIDADDHISNYYVSYILNALQSNPDCVGISGIYTTNNTNLEFWHISKDYGYWHTKDGVYLRTPNHISPVRRELALQAGFPEIERGEDAEYSRRLYPLLKTEVKISGNLYHYDYWIK